MMIKNMKRKSPILYFLLYGLLLSTASQAQQRPLDEYVQIGLHDNLIVTQKNLSLQRTMNALEVAKNLYLPSVSFDMLYSTANGGRSIDLPIGDMLNPVYQTLNQLTQSLNFPAIENQQIHFLPRNYYDAKVRTSMPLVNVDIKHQKDIQTQATRMSEVEIIVYKRELVKEIKSAYYMYLSVLESIKIYENSLTLAKEGKRVNEKLLAAGKGLPAYVLRSDAEIADVEAKLTVAKQKSKNAQFYFNALLNRAEETPIVVEESAKVQVNAEDLINKNSENREELKSLAMYIELQEMVEKMNKQVYIPKLSGFVDLGSQAEGMRFNKNSTYYMAGLQLSFPIFSANRNKLKIEESKIAVSQAQNSLAQAKQQLSLAVHVAENDVISSLKSYESAKVQLEAAASYQRLIQHGFREGNNTYIETVDARAQYTNAQLAYNIAGYKVLLAATKLERETSSYPL